MAVSDEETNSHYNYFRDYNPNTGRYIQKDPIGLKGGINWFGYVNANPLRYYDPEGKAIPIVVIAIVGIAAIEIIAVSANNAQQDWAGQTSPAPTHPWEDCPPYGGTGGDYSDDLSVGIIIGLPAFIPVTAASIAAIIAIANDESRKKDPQESAPKDKPAGTKPIDQAGLGHDAVHEIKYGIGARPKDWVGIAPDGSVITTNPDGTHENQGHYGDYTHGGKDSRGRR